MNFLKHFYNSKLDIIKKSNISDLEKNNQIKLLNNLINDYNSIGIKSEEDFSKYFYLKSIFGSSAKKMFNKNIDIYKYAYPEGIGIEPFKKRNIEKWIEALKNIYILIHQGKNRTEAEKIVTKDWDDLEKIDFDFWSKYYESGDYMKYKIAQFVGNIPVDSLRAKIPGLPERVIPSNQPQKESKPQEPITKQEVDSNLDTQFTIKQQLEKAKKDLVGRLNSAEKIYTNNDFKKILGDQYEAWLKGLHDLKRIVQTSKVAHIKSTMFKDLIIKQANKLNYNGYNIAAKHFIKLAQEIPDMPAESLDPNPSLEGSGLDSTDNEENKDADAAMEEFVKSLNGDDDDNDDNSSDDGFLTVAEDDDGNIVVIGQEAPITPVNPSEPPLASSQQPLDVTLENKEMPGEEPANPSLESVPEAIPDVSKDVSKTDKKLETGSDKKINDALNSITIDDVVKKLEFIVQLYKSRIIARELQVLDLYMQALDIDSYFTQTLSESLNKSLEGNQYGLSRVEDMLTKIRGASSERVSLEEIRQKFKISEQNKEQKKEMKALEEMNPQAPETSEITKQDVDAVNSTTPVAPDVTNTPIEPKPVIPATPAV